MAKKTLKNMKKNNVKSTKKISPKKNASLNKKKVNQTKIKKINVIHRIVNKLKANTKKVSSLKVSDLNPDITLTTIPKALKEKIDEVVKLSESTPAGFSDLKHLANKILEHAADIRSNLKKKMK